MDRAMWKSLAFIGPSGGNAEEIRALLRRNKELLMEYNELACS